MGSAINRAKLLLAILFLTIICGCTTPTHQLSDADRGKFSAVRISESVDKASEPFVLAPGGSIGLMFGAVGGLAVSGKIESDAKIFAKFLDKNSISVETVAREEIEVALRDAKKYRIAAADETQVPQLKISIKQYGFSVPHLLSSKVLPVIYIECNLVDDSGKVIWTAADRLLPSIASPMETTSWEALRDNPTIIEDQLRKASRYVALKIIQTL
ncbi:MAG: hypothetical protein EPO06_00435 [Burkholderiaceae bacterium]|nr:MAG: hypothetical protein EPO06_00435 [Burkholderiaceae bacterium]